MKLRLKKALSILLCVFVALSLVQAAGATEISAAPLNPDYINYISEEQINTAETVWTDTDSQNTAKPQIFTGSIIPAPSTPFWPSGEQVTAIDAICADAAPLPSYFNLRDEGRITPVRDQGDCNVGWAFATYGSLESTLLTGTGIEWDFSENNMKNLLSNGYPEGYDREPCDGGNADMSTAYLSRWSGPVNEADDQYELPIPSTDSPTNLQPVLHVQNVTWLPPRENSLDNDLLRQTIYEKGALYTEFNVSISCFGQNVSDYHNGTSYYLPAEGYTIDGRHVVTLVGWDDSYPATNFTVTPPGDGAFIVKNNWGTDAGDEGYLYISYYDTSFAREYSSVLFTAEPADQLDNNYQYDPLGWVRDLGYTNSTDPTTCYGANVFTADGYEDLRAVSFYTAEPDTEYVAAIFRDIDTPPGNEAGPVTWTSGTVDFSGYHTIPLPASVSLEPDQTFSVVLKVTSPTYTYPLAVETPVENYSSQAAAVPGQSYVSEDGDEWNDITDYFDDTNVCIKAFTTDALRVPTNYPTIKDAVDAARPGDTVIVESGIYCENVAINTSITLRGIDTGDGLPVIDACGNGSALSVTADGVTVEGFELTGSGEENWDAGIYVEADNATLVTLTAWENTGMGIAIGDSDNTILTGCIARDNGKPGIYMDSSSASTLTGCIARGNDEYGILVINSPGSTLTDCIVNDNAYDGIVIDGWDWNSLSEAGSDTTALSYDSEGIRYLPEAVAAGVYDNHLFREYSRIPSYDIQENEPEMRVSEEGEIDTYAVSGYSGVSLTGCQANNNTYDGICIYYASVLLTSCRADENKCGIDLNSAKNCILTNNSMEGNQYNFALYGWDDINFVHSIDTSNTVDGKPIYYLLNETGNPDGDFTDAGTLYAVNCTGLDIHDLTLSGNEHGIYFWNTTSSTITDVTAQENFYGIVLDTSSDIRIATCDATKNTQDGIYLRYCSAIEADNCRATDNGNKGMYLYDSEQCTLTGNAMTGNHYNFHVKGWEDGYYIHSIDMSNTVNGKPVYYLQNATGNPDGDFADAGTLYAVNCTGLDIHDLTLSNEYSGVFFRNCSESDIHDLTLSGNLYGILISTCTDISLDTITATENNYGISLEECSESTVRSCIGRNNGIGLFCGDSDTNLITDCTMQENDFSGIYISFDTDCTVRNCSTSLNRYGFYLYSSENSYISECTASNNTIGLRTSYSENGIFSLNSFVNNSAAEENSHDTLWNSPSSLSYRYGEEMYKHTSLMGNYWGEAYNGTDQNGDGIGDTPFTGDGFTDTFPLMESVGAYTFVNDEGNDGNDDGNGHAGAAGDLKAGDAVTMQFDGTAITGITITAAEGISMMAVTVNPVKTGPEGLNVPVYQYLEADLIQTTNNAIAEADFTFTVPKAWLTAQGLTPADVVLWRFHDGVWVPLPTEIVGEEGDPIVYRAVSPGFSYFAVGGGEVGVSVVTTTPAGTPIPVPVTEETAQPVVPSEREGEAATATPSPQSPAGIVTLLTGLGTAALLFRRH